MRIVLAVTVFIICFSSPMAFAGDLESKLDMALQAIGQLSEENKELRERLSKLEQRQVASSAIQTPATRNAQATPNNVEERITYLEEASSSKDKSILDRVSINGYSSFEFEKQVENEGFGDENGSFDADLFDIVLNVQVNDKLRAAADMTWEHGSASEDNRGNVALEYGFAEYSISDLFKLRAGKMFTPFGIFNEIHTAKPAYLSVKEAGSTNKPSSIIDNSPRFYPRWGTGLALQGDGSFNGKHIDYNLMVSNGEQSNTNPFEEDDNGQKAISFRTRYGATDDILLGYSLYYDDGRTSEIMSHSLHFEYMGDKVRLLGEGVWGEIDSSTASKLSHYGWFLQPSYHFQNGITPYFRFEHYDPDTDISDNHGFDAVLGLNYEYNDLIFKLENNYYFGPGGSTLGTLPGNDYNEIKGAIVVGF